jgi:DNA-binding transcriptional ArsR family regulator
MRRTTKSSLICQRLCASKSIIQALAHPLRILILEYIDIHKSVPVNKIYAALGIEQSVTSLHLSVLRKAGVVNTLRDGKFINYSVNYSKVEEGIRTTDVISDFVEDDFDAYNDFGGI